MRKKIILTALSFLTLLSPLPGISVGIAPERTAQPDIWVYRGFYAYFDGERARLATSDLEELRIAFVEDADNLQRLDADHPLSGQLDACDVFVLDNTEMYFDDAALPVGGLYGFGDINIMSGSLAASEIALASNLFIAPGCSLAIDCEINAGGAVECFGGTITAGGIISDSVWLDSSEAPLLVTTSDSVFTGFYTQSGGSVEIGGGLYCQPPVTQYNGALIMVNSEYARHGATCLTVSGDVVSLGGFGGVEVGGGSGVGGYDEAAFRALESERSNKKAAQSGAYDASPPASEVTMTVGGELRSLGTAVFYEGIG